MQPPNFMPTIMSANAELLEKRKELVPNGVGIFNTSTAVSAKDSVVIDAEGRELIDFAGGIGVLNTDQLYL